jgi:hypothetical protein
MGGRGHIRSKLSVRCADPPSKAVSLLLSYPLATLVYNQPSTLPMPPQAPAHLLLTSIPSSCRRSPSTASSQSQGRHGPESPSRGWPRQRWQRIAIKLRGEVQGRVGLRGEWYRSPSRRRDVGMGWLRGMAGRGLTDRQRRRLVQGGATWCRGVRRPRVAREGG